MNFQYCSVYCFYFFVMRTSVVPVWIFFVCFLVIFQSFLTSAFLFGLTFLPPFHSLLSLKMLDLFILLCNLVFIYKMISFMSNSFLSSNVFWSAAPSFLSISRSHFVLYFIILLNSYSSFQSIRHSFHLLGKACLSGMLSLTIGVVFLLLL